MQKLKKNHKMKKFTLILLAVALIAAPSCNNQNKKKAAEGEAQTEATKEQKMAAELLSANFKQMIEDSKQMKPAPFIQGKNGSIKLTDKEKMAKPDYLLDASASSALVTLTQKYRAVGMYSIDKEVARLYDMPVDKFDEALTSLAAGINDPAFNEFSEKVKGTKAVGEVFSKLLDDEIAAGRANFFWEGTAAAMVEQLYVMTRSIDKFMPMFDDQAASDLSYDFICIHEGIKQMMEYYPEMESLNKIIEPLYVINAISVDQLKSQLVELKGEIEVIRTLIAK